MDLLKRTLATVPLAVALAGPVLAGPVADAAAEAERLMAEGRTAAAVATMRAAMLDLQAQATALDFGTVALTAGEATGFGLYEPRADATFAPDEPVLIYAEVAGLAFADTGEGDWQVDFDVDLTVRTPDGAVLAEAPGIVRIETQAAAPAPDFYVTLTYRLEGAPAGDYVLVSTLRDRQSDRTGTFETAVTVTE